MTLFKLLKRTLLYNRKSFLWIVLGCAVSTSVIVGALVVGDSVRYSLRDMVFQRLGDTQIVLTSGDRYYREEMAQDLAADLGVPAAPLLYARGTVSSDGGLRYASRIQVLGVDRRFGERGGVPELYSAIPENTAVINQALAERLGLEVGGEFVLRIDNLDYMPRDTPLALDSQPSVVVRLTAGHISSDSEFGRFDLKADQTAPLSVFLSLGTLSRLLDLEARANTLLIAQRPAGRLTVDEVKESFARIWTLEDAGLSLKPLEGRNECEMRSSRVFIHPAVVESALRLDQKTQIILTYFVNDISSEGKSTPYSFVSAPGGPVVPADMADNEIILNSWLAEDLEASEGASVKLTYFVPGTDNRLEEQNEDFIVRSIVPLSGIYADRDLLPDFPGLADIESTRDWRPGIPIDLDRIRDKDERYWELYRGTPKAFVTMKAAQRMWRNRFGSATALRFAGSDVHAIESGLTPLLNPLELGYSVRDVRGEGIRASSQSVDFGQLFLGLSFFIILAGLLLTRMLFVFSLEKRSDELGLLLAMGFSKRSVQRINLGEGAVLALTGSILGGAAGLILNLAILAALETVWKGAVGTSSLRMFVNPLTVLAGAAAGFAAALLTIRLTGRKLLKTSITALQRGNVLLDFSLHRKPRLSLGIAAVSLGTAAVVLLSANFERGREAYGVFFSAGALILIGGMAVFNIILMLMGRHSETPRPNLFQIASRGITRRRTRSLTLIGLLACGLFIVFTVGANRLNAVKGAEKRDSGTGGFAFFGETSIPVFQNLNSPEGRRRFGLEPFSLENLSFVQFRVKEGDDASCLNLNRVSHPQILGVEPEELSGREAFRFIKWTEDLDADNPWSVLNRTLPDGSIPAVADNTVIIWGLGKSVGDTLTYEAETGGTFSVRLVGGLDNSVFQGNIIISEKAFLEKFPSISGTRLFLVDTAPEIRARVSGELRRTMRDYGLDLVSSAQRLAEFNRVENTYLSIFLILGTFGLVLGSLGLGIVVRRSVRERRGELALLRAVGFDRRSVRRLILIEHLILLLAGVFLGLVAAMAATIPSILAPGSEIPWMTIALLLAASLINGAVWTYAAAAQETRGNLLRALRAE